MKINSSEVKFSALSTGDDVGAVFFWNGEVYRAIRNDQVEHIRDLFNCGLIGELGKLELIPETILTEHTLDGFGAVLHHGKISSVSYPFEWSFEMLKEAALTAIQVNRVAMKYGYQTKDCHSFNLLFNGTKAVYVDLGSFVRTESKSLICYEEFLKSYSYLLELASLNEYHWVKQLSTTGSLISHESFFLYKYALLRRLSLANVRRFVSLWRFLNSFDNSYDGKIRRKLGGLGSFILNMRDKQIFPFQSRTLDQLEREVARIKKLDYRTMWGDYQGNFDSQNPRFNRILEIIRPYNIKTAFEVAGNQGFFANMLIEQAGFQSVNCSDYDENAVDQMFLRYKGSKALSPVLMNFLFPNHTSFTLPAGERFRAQIVFALAVSHHVLLTQRQNVDLFFHSLAGFTSDFIAVEFMPMGLWDSVSNTAPATPDWYTQDWFREHFEKRFTLIHEETVAKNRVLFFGRLKVNSK